MSQAPPASAAEPAAPESHDAPKRFPRWRRWLAGLLIVVSCVLSPFMVLAIWVRNQVLSTDRYVSTVAPLATNPHIIDTAATQMTNALFDNVDVEQVAKEALPPRAEQFAGALTTGLHTVVSQLAHKVLSSEQFAKVWEEANKRAHSQVQKALTGGGKVVSTKNGKVEINLQPILESVRLKLKQRGIGLFDNIPADKLAIKFELFDAKQLKNAQSAVRVLNTVAWILPFFILALLGVALWLSPHRRRSLVRWAIGIVIAMAILGLGLAIGKSVYLDAVSSDALPRATADAVWTTMVRYLRGGVRLIAAIGVVVALAAWLTGNGHVATSIRNGYRRTFDWLGDKSAEQGWTFGAFGAWVRRFKYWIGGVALLLAIAAIVFAYRPTAIRVFVIALLLLVFFGLIETIGEASTKRKVSAPS
ncbi:MAG TPA: hypothetical protein VIC35_01715 [Acidimicrobiia bacterium]